MTKGWNEVFWNEVVMERSDRIPNRSYAKVKILLFSVSFVSMYVPRCSEVFISRLTLKITTSFLNITLESSLSFL